MQKPTLVAVDTNVLMRLADRHDATVTSWELIRQRLAPVQFIVTPTVLGEVASKTLDDPDPAVRIMARKALEELRPQWHFQPADFNAVEGALATSATARLRESGLVPYEERNDAGVIAEAAVLNCVLLVSRDSHLLCVDYAKLLFLLQQLDLNAPLICSPEDLIQKFYR